MSFQERSKMHCQPLNGLTTLWARSFCCRLSALPHFQFGLDQFCVNLRYDNCMYVSVCTWILYVSSPNIFPIHRHLTIYQFVLEKYYRFLHTKDALSIYILWLLSYFPYSLCSIAIVRSIHWPHVHLNGVPKHRIGAPRTQWLRASGWACEWVSSLQKFSRVILESKQTGSIGSFCFCEWIRMCAMGARRA